MPLYSWLRNLQFALAPCRGQRQHARRGSKRAPTYRPSLEVLEGRLTPSFTPVASYAVGARAVLAADFDNDTVPDLALNTGQVLRGHGDGTFDSPVNSDAAYLPMAVGDLDGDGNMDLAVIDTSARDVHVYLGHGDGTLAAPININVTDPNGPEYLESVAVGDFNRDGLLDLGATSSVYVYDGYDPNYGSFGHFKGYAKVLVGTGGGAFSGPNTTALGDAYLRKSAVADFNGDRIDDLAMIDFESEGSVRVLLGSAGGFFHQSATVLDRSYPSSVAVADVDGDRRAELVIGTGPFEPIGGVSVLLGNGAGGFGSPHQYSAPGSADRAVAVADFNGDGRLDIVATAWSATGASPTSYIGVLLGRGDGTFASAITKVLDAGPVPKSLVADDFNGDGLPDVAVLSVDLPVQGTRSQVDVLLNDRAWSPGDPRSVSIGDASVIEGNTGTVNASFAVTLSHASNVDVTVHYATANITATAGSDYTAASGAVTIPAGQTSASIVVPVHGDRIAEPNETFAVNLSAATGATIGDGQGVGTILDDEPRISISDFTRAEGKRNKTTLFTFTVTLSAPYDQPVSVSFQTVNGTATTGDNDYVAKTGAITFNPGEKSKTITIVVNGDSKREANETFFVDLFGNSSNSWFTKKRGTGAILNDD
jgi:hypothetical protein